MRLVEIARYPVKSLQGEVVSSAEIELDGVRGDRCWGIRDQNTGKILTGRRAPQLLFATTAQSRRAPSHRRHHSLARVC
ncbi:MAG: MOSC N-terminal beta barrel domain-containing protein [Isosphaeraceae bacterium]